MKKILLIAASVLVMVSTAFAQGKIQNNSYFVLATNRAILDYGTIKDYETSNNLREYYNDKYDDLKHYRGAMTLGANFYIHPIGWLIEGFKAGLCLDFIDLGVDYYRFYDKTREISGSTFTYAEEETYSDLTVSYSFNAGVVATVSPFPKFYIDLTAKLCPTFAVNYFKIPAYVWGVKANAPVYERRNPGAEWGGYEFTEDFEGTTINMSNVATKNDEQTGIGLGLDYAFGIDIRYSKLLVGCEWYLGNIKFAYDDWDDQKVHNQRFRVKLGLSFD